MQDAVRHPLPVLHDQSAGDSQHQIALLDEREVPATVLLEGEPGVKLLAVEFEHETIADEQVDAADARHPDLAANPDALPDQEQAQEGLQAGLAAAVAE